MQTERHVRLSRDGQHQSLRIPPELELPGDEVIIRKVGRRLIVEPSPRPSLLGMLAALETLDEDFPEIEDLPPEDVTF